MQEELASSHFGHSNPTNDLDNDDEIMQIDGISNDSPTGPHLIEEDDPGEPEGAEDEDAWTRTGGRLRSRR